MEGTGSYTGVSGIDSHLHDDRATLEEQVEQPQVLVAWRLVFLLAFYFTGAPFFVFIIVVEDGLLPSLATSFLLTSFCTIIILCRSDLLIIVVISSSPTTHHLAHEAADTALFIAIITLALLAR